MGRITKEDCSLIKGLREEKQWGAKRLMKEFPSKRWSLSSITRLLQKIDNDGTTQRKPGSGRPRSVRTTANIKLVHEMICSQDDKPHTLKSPREIERETGLSRTF